MKNLHTKKTSTGGNFDWLIRQMSINQKSGQKMFHRRFVSGSLFISPYSPECYLQSKTKREPDLRLETMLTMIRKVNPLQWLFVRDPYTNLYFLIIQDSFYRSKFVIIFYEWSSNSCTIFTSNVQCTLYSTAIEISAQQMFIKKKSVQFQLEKKFRVTGVGFQLRVWVCSVHCTT